MYREAPELCSDHSASGEYCIVYDTTSRKVAIGFPEVKYSNCIVQEVKKTLNKTNNKSLQSRIQLYLSDSVIDQIITSCEQSNKNINDDAKSSEPEVVAVKLIIISLMSIIITALVCLYDTITPINEPPEEKTEVPKHQELKSVPVNRNLSSSSSLNYFSDSDSDSDFDDSDSDSD